MATWYTVVFVFDRTWTRVRWIARCIISFLRDVKWTESFIGGWVAQRRSYKAYSHQAKTGAKVKKAKEQANRSKKNVAFAFNFFESEHSLKVKVVFSVQNNYVRLVCIGGGSDITSRWVHREFTLMFTLSSDKDQRKKLALRSLSHRVNVPHNLSNGGEINCVDNIFSLFVPILLSKFLTQANGRV